MSDVAVLVLMGGPDAEREISLRSGAMVANALREAGGFVVHEHVIERPASGDLRALPGDVIFPVLHGPFGEGGPLQELMEFDGRPYVGSRPRAARVAMDKITSKLFARAAGIRTPPARLLTPGEPIDLPLPVVIKPVEDGSSVGVRRCFTQEQVDAARAELEPKHPRLMAESLITGREITVGVFERELLPMIEVVANGEFYDYDAKYERNDTKYLLDPQLSDEVRKEIADASRLLYERIGCRDLARLDFMVDADGAWFLEINSMPGMTDHSLVPKAAAHMGIAFPQMCSRLVMRSLQRMKGNNRPHRGHASSTADTAAVDADTAAAAETTTTAQETL